MATFTRCSTHCLQLQTTFHRHRSLLFSSTSRPASLLHSRLAIPFAVKWPDRPSTPLVPLKVTKTEYRLNSPTTSLRPLYIFITRTLCPYTTFRLWHSCSFPRPTNINFFLPWYLACTLPASWLATIALLPSPPSSSVTVTVSGNVTPLSFTLSRCLREVLP